MFLENDEQDELIIEDEPEQIDDEENYLEEEETLEELDVDARGHVRPRRSHRDEEDSELD